MSRSPRFRRIRLIALTLLLIAIAAWAAGEHRRRARRREWRRPLHVSVLLLDERDAQSASDASTGWREGLSQLEQWIAREQQHYRAETVPVDFTLFGPLVVKESPSFLPEDDGLWTRAKHAWSLWRALSALNTRANLPARDYDVRLYVALAPAAAGAPRFAEGAGAQDGDVGFVRATAGEDLSLALAAVAHELFHCLGAVDQYDAAGHALEPDGLVEPERAPRYPQPAAEIMAGELPTAPGAGRVPGSLDEQRVGAATARAIGWRAAREPE